MKTNIVLSFALLAGCAGNGLAPISDPPSVLATDQYTNGLTHDATMLYWTTQHKTVMRTSLADNAPTVLVAGLADQPWAIAVDAASIYFITLHGSVMKAALDGTDVTTLASDPTIWSPSLALDATSLYWTTDDGRVVRESIDGGKPVEIVTGEDIPMNIAVRDGRVYWSTENAIRTATTRGADVHDIATHQTNVSSLVVDETSAYWVTALGTVMKAPLAGGATTALVTGLPQGNEGPFGAAVDSSGLYWTNGSGIVERVGLDGGARHVIAMGQDFPSPITLAAANVYWANTGEDNQVVKSAK